MKNPILAAGAMLLSCIVGGAYACDDCQRDTDAADAMIVVRDAQTGQLRAPTATEAAALQATKTRRLAASARAAAVAATPAAPTVRSFPSSTAHSARLPQSLASYSVVRRAPDGSLAEVCVQSSEAASQALRTIPASVPVTTRDNTK